MKRAALFLAILLVGLGSCKDSNEEEAGEEESTQAPVVVTPSINFRVVNTFKHDPSLFTEGLLIHKGQLFESTGSPEGLPGAKSMIGVIDLVSGKMNTRVEIDRSKYFGEGIVIFGSKLYQLTYTTQLGFIYDLKTFKQIGTFKYANKEGWGITTNGKELIMSDGSSNLTFLSPDDLQPFRSLPVSEDGLPVTNLNELEYIKGFIYANIWMTNYIYKIDPANGKVVGKVDLSSLSYEAKNRNPGADVLNGIAYDPETDKIYVTGKLWPNIYQIDFVH
jgi:glutaminyl-peptide cyclotransferase